MGSKSVLIVISILVAMSATPSIGVEKPSGTVVFHEDWDRYSASDGAPIQLGTGSTHAVWLEEFSDNTAWVLTSGQTNSQEHTGLVLPVAAPDAKIWDAPGMTCSGDTKATAASLWLPFGKHGMNRVRHDFAKPYPTRGAVDSFIWVQKAGNMRQRGVTLILETPGNGEARVSFGMWAGTSCPSYKIEGIRKRTPGYDDSIYHRIPEIKLKGEGNPPTCANTWNDFIIDVGKTKKDTLMFRYRNHLTPEEKSSAMAKPLELVLGKDYTGIKAIVIGSLPYSNYAGKNELGDNAVFVDDVYLTER